MLDFEEAITLLASETVLCVGDLMLDEFVYGEVSRISPEAPVPIVTARKSELTLGGAGNVARNIVALGASCIFVAVVGEDDASRTLVRALAAEPQIEPLDHQCDDEQGERQPQRGVRQQAVRPGAAAGTTFASAATPIVRIIPAKPGSVSVTLRIRIAA